MLAAEMQDNVTPDVSSSGAEGQSNEAGERYNGNQGSHLRRSLHRDALCIRQQFLCAGPRAAGESGQSHGRDIVPLEGRNKFPGTPGTTIRFRRFFEKDGVQPNQVTLKGSTRPSG